MAVLCPQRTPQIRVKFEMSGQPYLVHYRFTVPHFRAGEHLRGPPNIPLVRVLHVLRVLCCAVLV